MTRTRPLLTAAALAAVAACQPTSSKRVTDFSSSSSTAGSGSSGSSRGSSGRSSSTGARITVSSSGSRGATSGSGSSGGSNGSGTTGSRSSSSGTTGSSGGVASTTSGGSTGTSGSGIQVCAPCSQDPDCGPHGACIHETESDAFCAPACTSFNGCTDLSATCLPIQGSPDGQGCYPPAQTCLASGSTGGTNGGGPNLEDVCDACGGPAGCVAGSRCIDEGNPDHGYCLPPCGPGNACPATTTCTEFEYGDGLLFYGCYPEFGSCGP